MVKAARSIVQQGRLGAPADAADRIVAATLSCLERDGVEGLTVRAITMAAGVNVAAINYYFGSKDHLVALALERSLDAIVADPLDALERRLERGIDLRDALVHVLHDYVAAAVARPRATFAHLHGPIALQDYRRDAVVRLNALLERLFLRARPRLAARGDAAKRAVLSELWSTLLLASLAPGLLQPFTRVDLRSPRACRRWISSLVDRAITARRKPASRVRASRRSVEATKPRAARRRR